MFRQSLIVIAAMLMTLSAFSGTIRILTLDAVQTQVV